MSRNRSHNRDADRNRHSTNNPFYGHGGGTGGTGGRRQDQGQERRVPGNRPSHPIDPAITGSAAQAAHAAALQVQSQQANKRPFNKRPAQPGNQLANQGNTRPGGGGAGKNKSGKGAGNSTSSTAGMTNQKPSGPRSGILDETVQDTMLVNMAPQSDVSLGFSPGVPLQPAEELVPLEGPRGRDYPVGINIAGGPRAGEGLSSFAQLRLLALNYGGVQICEQVWFDVASRLRPKVRVKPELIPDGQSENDPVWRKLTQPAQLWLDRPDGEQDFTDWFIASLRDMLEIGYSTLYLRRDFGGEVLGIDVIDSSTMKVVQDERGRQPQPPYPAYQQWIKGVPAGEYRNDEIELLRDVTRAESVYPLSRVERILLHVNQALRKQQLDLARYTMGGIPDGIIFPDTETGWTPEQVEDYERAVNGMMAGNDRAKVALKVGPPGGVFQPTRPDDPHLDFDTFCLNITVAIFGLSMDEVAFTATSNRSVGESQQNVIYRRVVAPVAARYQRVLTRVIQTKFDDDRLIVAWDGYEETEDELAKSNTLKNGVLVGALSPSRMARMMNWPVDLEVPPMLLTKTGPVWLEDALALREAQVKAQLAGLEFAMGVPGSDQASAVGDESGATADDANGGTPTSAPAPTQGNSTPPPGTPGTKNTPPPNNGGGGGGGGKGGGGSSGGKGGKAPNPTSASDAKDAAAQPEAGGGSTKNGSAASKAASTASTNGSKAKGATTTSSGASSSSSSSSKKTSLSKSSKASKKRAYGFDDDDDADDTVSDAQGWTNLPSDSPVASPFFSSLLSPTPSYLDPDGTGMDTDDDADTDDDTEDGGGDREERDAMPRRSQAHHPHTVGIQVETGETGETVDAETEAQVVAVRTEYQQWYRAAMNALRHGRRLPRFVVSAIPMEDYAYLARDLAHATTADEVRTAFNRARQRDVAHAALATRATRANPRANGRVTAQELASTYKPNWQKTAGGLKVDTRAVLDTVTTAGAHAAAAIKPPHV